jgi:hypothetical protein
MTTQTKKPAPIFPDIPVGQPLVDENGYLKSTWDFALNDIFQGLQTNFSNEGVLFPALDANDIATIQAIYNPALIGSPLPQGTPDISGKTIFDSTNRVPKIFIITYDISGNIVTAAWKTFTLT